MEGHRGDNTRWDDAKILIGMKTIIFGHTFSTKNKHVKKPELFEYGILEGNWTYQNGVFTTGLRLW